MIAVLGTVALGLGTVGLVNQFDAALPTIGDPPPPGSINLYFDRPDVRAQLNVEVTSALATMENEDYASDAYVVRVLAEGLDQNDMPTFFIALGGSALPRDDLADQSDRQSSNGRCSSATVSAVPELACIETSGSPDSAWASNEVKEDIVVVSGRLKPVGEHGGGIAYLDISAYASTLVKSGQTEVFQLPTVGTTYLPATIGDEAEIVIDDFTGLKVPSPLSITVSYGRLSPADRLESVSIEPITREPLTWVETSRATLTPSGTITDSRAERDAGRVTFFWGVLAGILGSLLLPLLGWWRVTVAACWRWGICGRTSNKSVRGLSG
ncbi:hypothetical protein [Frigoribacterium sp. PhB116]|uniref:hypothetical protein n=1 Tax=Frigoribacterium sp. PhB116 TaxID=2485174 RepID=UPI001060AD80|nr:hypothetical protein [Frigoribacterium sp. PhB116]